MATYLFLDFETFSLANLKKVGLDNYLKHPSTGISVLSWGLNREELSLWAPHTGAPPAKLVRALLDPTVTKVAWNAAFDYGIVVNVMSKIVPDLAHVPLNQFLDPMILARSFSLPGKLENVAEILKMAQRKDPRGDKLKKMFCNPVNVGTKSRRIKACGEITLFGPVPPLFRDHNSHPKEFAEYGEYCLQDSIAMRDLLYFFLDTVRFPQDEWRGWLLDQKLNSFGIPTRRDLAEKGLRLALKWRQKEIEWLVNATGLENPLSDTQIKKWASTRGYKLESMRAPTVKAEVDNLASSLTPECREVLKRRASARKSSYSKIEKILAILSNDDRIRYQFRYMGAPRTGRWASGGKDDTGTSAQLQNFSRGEKAVKKKLKTALELLDREDYDGIVKEFTDTPNKKDSITVMDFVITLLRSLFQAGAGKRFIVADKNAIENRMLGWASGCKAILDVFRLGRCPYMSFGAVLFGIPYEQWYYVDEFGVHKPKPEFEEKRQMAKPPVLGGGYGLGGGEMYKNEYGDTVRGGLWGYALTVCGVDMPQDLAHKAMEILKKAWPEVVQFWDDLEEAFKQVLRHDGIINVGEVTWNRYTREWEEHPTKGKQCVISFRRITMPDGRHTICMDLPSGRSLHYLNCTIEEESRVSKKTKKPYTAYTIYYDGIEHSATQGEDGQNKKKKHKWGRVKTYGGKLCENAIQAMSRDDLLNSMFLADEMGFHLIGLFHDEILCEETYGGFDTLRLSDLIWCMTRVPWWANGLILGAEGYEDLVYHK